MNHQPLPKTVQPPVTSATTDNNGKPVIIKLSEAKNSTGKLLTVTGNVYSAKDIGSMVLVNLGAAYPNQDLTLALKGAAKSLASKIDGKTITIEGTVIDYKGKPEIIVTDPTKVKW